MANLGTAKRLLQEVTGRYGSSDPDYITHAIASAMRFYQDENFEFNQGTYDFTLVAGTASYGQESSDGAGDGYPDDLIKPINLSLQVSSTWYKMTNISIREYRERFLETTYRGYPKLWTWLTKKFYLEPAPNGAYTIRLDYTKDIGIISESYTSDVWIYTDTSTGATVGDSWTSDWLDDAHDLILARAAWWLCTHILKDRQAGQLFKMDEMEHLRQLKIASEHQQDPEQITPWI